jgi:hypothetical protein
VGKEGCGERVCRHQKYRTVQLQARAKKAKSGECMSGGMVKMYYLLALSRRTRPRWPLEEGWQARGRPRRHFVMSRHAQQIFFARPGHGAIRRCFYLLATSTLLAYRKTSRVITRAVPRWCLCLVCALQRRPPPPPLSCLWAMATSQPSNAAAFALLPSLYPSRRAILLFINPSPRPSQSRRRCPRLPQSASRLAYPLR